MINDIAPIVKNSEELPISLAESAQLMILEFSDAVLRLINYRFDFNTPLGVEQRNRMEMEMKSILKSILTPQGGTYPVYKDFLITYNSISKFGTIHSEDKELRTDFLNFKEELTNLNSHVLEQTADFDLIKGKQEALFTELKNKAQEKATSNYAKYLK